MHCRAVSSVFRPTLPGLFGESKLAVKPYADLATRLRQILRMKTQQSEDQSCELFQDQQ